MKKIISLFKRDYEGTRLVYNEVTPGAEWVSDGYGYATLKIDGTCCMVEGGKLYKRYDAKNGKTPPAGFIPAQDPDPVTGHWPGWVLVDGGRNDKYHLEAWEKCDNLQDGTYELIGEKVQGNPYGIKGHELVRHGATFKEEPPRDYEGLKAWFESHEIEGIVWHHPDGRMVKIKRRDFGLKWGRE